MVDNASNLCDEKGDLTGEGEDEGEYDIEEEEHKEFAVAKSDTVGDPGTMVVHIQDATLARRAVMTSNSKNNYL